MQIHALEASGGLMYAEMGRFLAKADPSSPKGTSDEAAALKDEQRQAGRERLPEHLGDGDRALDRAERVLHGQQIALFGLVVGIALLLSGVGFLILAISVLGGATVAKEATKAAATATPVTS